MQNLEDIGKFKKKFTQMTIWQQFYIIKINNYQYYYMLSVHQLVSQLDINSVRKITKRKERKKIIKLGIF